MSGSTRNTSHDGPWLAPGAMAVALHLGTPHRVLDSGSTNPIVFQLDDDDGPAGLWVVKLQRGSAHAGLSLLRERIGSELAASLGIMTPLIGSLRLPHEPLGTDETPLGRSVADAYRVDAGRLAFCSRFVSDATTVGLDDLADLRSVSDEAQDDAIRIFVFDVFVRHYDRSRRNPNLLARDGRLVAIDHGMILADLFRVDQDGVPDPAPERTDDVHRFADHVCATIAKKRPDARTWDDACATVAALDDAELTRMATRWPAELDRSTMGGPAGMISQTVSFLKRRRDAFPRALEHVRAALSS